MKDTYPLLSENEEQIKKEEEENIDNLIRKGFIVKVYGLLLIQLAITFSFVFLSIEIKVLSIFLRVHFYFLIVMVITPFIILICFLIKPQLTIKVPINYILLFIFCLSEGYLIARFAIEFQKRYVYFSLLLTLTAVLTLTIYAYYTKEDFTLLGGILCVVLILLIVGGIVNIFLRMKLLKLILNITRIILFSFYIIYDTQLIIGNKERTISEEDYILAVINLYLDIINLFIQILSFFGSKK